MGLSRKKTNSNSPKILFDFQIYNIKPTGLLGWSIIYKLKSAILDTKNLQNDNSVSENDNSVSETDNSISETNNSLFETDNSVRENDNSNFQLFKTD
jgi:hypothetical protein